MARFHVKRLLASATVACAIFAGALFGASQAGYDVPFFPTAAASDLDPDAILPDLDGRRVALDLAPDIAGADVADTGGRFVVPSVGVDLPLMEMTITRGVLNPPTLTDAFLVRGTGHERPLIVALHSIQGGRAAGNALAQVGANGRAQAAVAPGDVVSVDGEAFTVTSVAEMRKDKAALAPEIWQAVAGGTDRLVIITCLQHPGGPRRAPTNLVIHAARA